VSPVKYELGLYIPEDCTFQSHRRENLKSCPEQAGVQQIVHPWVTDTLVTHACQGLENAQRERDVSSLLSFLVCARSRKGMASVTP
jgi:hypothetical protein